MWYAVLVIAIVLLLAMQILIRRFSERAVHYMRLAFGGAIILMAVVAPGAYTWHRTGLIVLGILSIGWASWKIWATRARPV